MEEFLSHVSRLARRETERRRITGLQEIAMQVGIIDIFHGNHDPEKVYYELLDFLEKQREISGIIPDVKKFYETHYLSK